MARNLLSHTKGGAESKRSRLRFGHGAAIAASCAVLFGCKHDHPTTITTAPSAAAADSVSEGARQARFDDELKRAQTRLHERSGVGNCDEVLHEGADLELCHKAQSSLSSIEQLGPTATPEVIIPALAEASLSLVRLLERARLLNMAEFGKRKLDAGVPPKTASATTSPPSSASTQASKLPRALSGLLRERPTLKMGDSPLMHFVENTARMERDVIRELGAYLEYGPAPVRHSAFASVKQLQAEHPRWPALNHLIREAAVLETDGQLKQNLNELGSLGLPVEKSPDQPTGSK